MYNNSNKLGQVDAQLNAGGAASGGDAPQATTGSKYELDAEGTGALGSYTSTWESILPPGASFYWRMQPPRATASALHVENKKSLVSPAPRLQPISDPFTTEINQAVSRSVERPSTHINVRDDHHWTESPISSRGEVPMLHLKEYDVLQNAGINQVIQNMSVTVENIDDMAAQVIQVIEGFKGADGIGQGFKQLIGKIKDRVEDFSTEGKAIEDRQEKGSADPMNVYDSMYARRPTGFKYTFPYMENSQFTSSGGYSAEVEMNGLLGTINDIAGIAQQMSSSMNLRKVLNPGRMIEMPKNYNFTGRERSYTIKFPLFNTKNYNEIIKNWQFIFLLSYQNTPNRVSKELINPPCQYEAYIPGVWYSKYCTITNMTVDYRGARREMEVPIPFLDVATNEGQNWLLQKRSMYTIIPDAYEVSITLTEIFGETQNSMYHMLTESIGSKIKTGTA